MAVMRAQWGDQDARQGQIARAQAAGARRSDVLARDRFNLDRQDDARSDFDARSRAREAASARAQADARESRPAAPSQDRGTSAVPAREISARETSTRAASRPGGTGAADAAEPVVKTAPKPTTESAGRSAGEPATGPERGPEGAAADPTGRTAPGGNASDEADRAETMPGLVPPITQASPAAGAPLAAGAASRQGTGPMSGADAPQDAEDRAGTVSGEKGQAAVRAGTGTVAGTAGEPAGGIADRQTDGAGTAFAAILSETAPTAAPDAAPPSAAAPASDKPVQAALTAVASASAKPSETSGSASASQPPVPIGAVPMTIGLRSLAGTNRFEMRLDPVELGRIDVTLDIDRGGGTVSANLVVDSPATLALLRRDADSLQQALAQAGFNAGDAGITLQLRQDGTSGGGSQDGADGRGEGRPAGSGARPDAASLDPIPLRALRPVSGLDIRI